MICNETREVLLDLGCNDADRRRAIDALEHLQGCASCRGAMADFDQLAMVLAAGGQQAAATADSAAGGWEEFQRRLSPRSTRIQWRGMVLAGLAASLMTAFALHAFGPADKALAKNPVLALDQAQSNPSPPQPATIQFTPHDVTRGVTAFDQVASVFDHRASWLLVSDNAADMGLSNEPLVVNHHLLLIRLTMLHADKIVSKADLAIVPGQTAKLQVPLGDGVSIQYAIGTSSDQPTRLTIWAQLMTPQGGESLAALATTLQMQTGDKRSAGTMMTSSGDYDLQIAFSRADLP